MNRFCFTSVALLLVLAGNVIAQERLTAPQLFPEQTLAYVRVSDVAQLKEDLNRCSIGKLGNDPQLQPIFAEFYGSLVKGTQEMEKAIGLNLDELLSIPSGELALAVISSQQSSGSFSNKQREDGRTEVSVRLEAPAIAMVLDAGDEITSVQVVLKRIDEAVGNNMEHSSKKIDSLTLHRYQNPEKRDQRFAYYIDRGVLVACSDADFLEVLAKVWLGQDPEWKSLADNKNFTSILSRCVGTQGERPQVSFYADPMGMLRQFSPKNAAGMTTMALLPALGFDGLQGIGGSWIVAPPDFDSISHLQIQLGSPRRSVLALLRPKSGSTTPEDWVPDDVAGYSTINWDLTSTIKAIEQLFNQFRGQDAFQNEVIARVSDRLNLDFRKDILENFDGRISILQGFVRPVTINSGSNVYAIKLRNPNHFESMVLPKLIEQIGSRTTISEAYFGKVSAKVIEVGRNIPEGSAMRRPELCIAMVDDYLVLADSKFMMRQVADCQSGNKPPLKDALEFQLISDRISAHLQGKECAALNYARPEESLQLFYELARDPKNRDRLRAVADNNGFFKALLAALEKHDLPPFSVISKYLAPGGGFLVDDETGLHYMSFSLRRE